MASCCWKNFSYASCYIVGVFNSNIGKKPTSFMELVYENRAYITYLDVEIDNQDNCWVSLRVCYVVMKTIGNGITKRRHLLTL